MTDANGNPVSTYRVLADLGPWAAIIFGGIVYVVSSAMSGDSTAKSLNDFKAQVAGEFSDTRSQMATGFLGVQNQISTLPDYAARLKQVEGHLGVIDNHLSALDARADGLERQEYQLSITVGNLDNASKLRGGVK